MSAALHVQILSEMKWRNNKVLQLLNHFQWSGVELRASYVPDGSDLTDPETVWVHFKLKSFPRQHVHPPESDECD